MLIPLAGVIVVSIVGCVCCCACGDACGDITGDIVWRCVETCGQAFRVAWGSSVLGRAAFRGDLRIVRYVAFFYRIRSPVT